MVISQKGSINMKNILNKNVKRGIVATLIGILVIALVFGLDYCLTVGIIYLICKCFGWKFTFAIATGVWLIINLAVIIFKRGGGNGNKN